MQLCACSSKSSRQAHAHVEGQTNMGKFGGHRSVRVTSQNASMLDTHLVTACKLLILSAEAPAALLQPNTSLVLPHMCLVSAAELVFDMAVSWVAARPEGSRALALLPFEQCLPIQHVSVNCKEKCFQNCRMQMLQQMWCWRQCCSAARCQQLKAWHLSLSG